MTWILEKAKDRVNALIVCAAVKMHIHCTGPIVLTHFMMIIFTS